MNQKIICIVLLLITCIHQVAAASIVPLTDDPAINLYQFWSPDGKHIAFTSSDNDYVGIRVMEGDGRNLRQVTEKGSWEFAPFDPWSPDGTTLLFVSGTGEEFDLWTMHPDGSGRVRLTEGARIFPVLLLSGYGADWSADGKQIVYTSCLFENAEIWEDFLASATEDSPTVNLSEIRKDADIWIMDADSGNKRPLTSSGDVRSPQWQPYGDTIAYLSDQFGMREVWTVNRDGTGAMQVTFSEGNVSEYAWSPDGTAIAYVVSPALEPEFSIWITEIEGNDTEQLTAGHWDRSPVWSPDGARIAFTSMSRNRTAIWVMKSDGSDLIPLTPEDTRFFMMPQWSPDGKEIVVSDGNDLFVVILDDPQQTTPALPGLMAFEVLAAFSVFTVGVAYLRRR